MDNLRENADSVTDGKAVIDIGIRVQKESKSFVPYDGTGILLPLFSLSDRHVFPTDLQVRILWAPYMTDGTLRRIVGENELWIKPTICLVSKDQTPTYDQGEGGKQRRQESLKKGKSVNTTKGTQIHPCPEDCLLGPTTNSNYSDKGHIIGPKLLFKVYEPRTV